MSGRSENSWIKDSTSSARRCAADGHLAVVDPDHGSRARLHEGDIIQAVAALQVHDLGRAAQYLPQEVTLRAGEGDAASQAVLGREATRLIESAGRDVERGWSMPSTEAQNRLVAARSPEADRCLALFPWLWRAPSRRAIARHGPLLAPGHAPSWSAMMHISNGVPHIREIGGRTSAQ